MGLWIREIIKCILLLTYKSIFGSRSRSAPMNIGSNKHANKNGA
jgi:hypothetical protein